MQTRFALINLANSFSGQSGTAFVAYLKGRWSALRIVDASTLLLNVFSETTEPRVMSIRSHLGYVTNTDKPFIEIGMLLKRHVIWSNNQSYSDDPFDWKVEKITEITIPEFPPPIRVNTGFWEAFNGCLVRLYGGAHVQRTLDVVHNIRQRHHTIVDKGLAPVYAGFLAFQHGAFWKGGRYIGGFDERAYTERRRVLDSVGALLGDCLACEKAGTDYSGVMTELAEVLCQQTTTEHHLTPDILTAKVLPLLARLSRNTLVLCGCGHFELRGVERPVRSGGVFVSWCADCFEADSCRVEDAQERWAIQDCFWSENHDAYYSYDIDAEEDGDETEYEDNSRSILDYSTNVTRILKSDPKIKSSPYGEFLMGLELELTTGNRSRSVAAKEIRKQLGGEYCVIKNDGSLPDDGIEIVTAPRGLIEHIEKFSKWEINPLYRAWDTDQCGLHVHLHSKGFTEMALGKFLMFINLDTNAPFLRKLAGRHPLKDTWAARYCAHEGAEILENPKAAVKGKSRERYRMVNTQNLGKAEAERLGLDPYSYSGKYDTVELRVFKASLKKTRLLAQIEFAHAAVMFCRVASYRDLTGKAFLQWLQPHTRMYPNLADWYGARKSKAIKDAGGKALEALCVDKVYGDVAIPQRAVRATRPRAPLTNINQYLTPAARREAQERELQENLRRGQERLRQAREAASVAIAAERSRLDPTVFRVPDGDDTPL